MQSAPERAAIEIGGIVQGVGFRPFVYRLANRLGLSGWVRNTGEGVQIEVEGDAAAIEEFRLAVRDEAPPLAVIYQLRAQPIPAAGATGFAIVESARSTAGGEVSPDCDVCDDCLAELFDPDNRRHGYPFINCTNCGPRYSIITGIPYDRPATTMAGFAMCDDCLAEYHDPGNRRFHAQPNACPVCGPHLSLLEPSGAPVCGDALKLALEALSQGKIVAVKGVGGYHLAVDAGNQAAVERLRQRKRRDEKPFAMLAADLEMVRRHAHCSELEGRLLLGVERPIVLMRKLAGSSISDLVAPGNGWFGFMLPGNPLQHLLARGHGAPLVMTSGNLSDEPIAYRDGEALEMLSGIADLFLTHDREIHTRTDDSVLRLYRGEPLFLRRSRGYVPRAVQLPAEQASVLAVGGELKATLCLTRGDRAFMSQHIGDLKNAATLASLEQSASDLQSLLEITPALVAHDLHPDYLSTHYATALGLPAVGVQHHHAHMASCMAENGLEGEVIGVILDGTGYGTDGTTWGGEFLVGGYSRFERHAHFAPLRLPGGDAAVKEPYRMALSALYSLHGDRLFDQPPAVLSEVAQADRPLFLKMLEKGINSPLTSSCGRLFDAVSALIGVRSRISYEGQAAIELEALAEQGGEVEPYPCQVREEWGHVLDFAPAIAAICADLARGRSRADIARAFHRTVARGVLDVCRRLREETGYVRVVLSGGVFQNRLLTEEVAELLAGDAFQVYCHRLVPPNDGGLALGQAAIAGTMQARG
ncbi:hydrogenase maturation protein HypF [Citrifermentans bemidjiense Bem]|uniref:Carbamoyltransferase n=1 Tax=Citrifermentans bemidjiense (strain ATCC BAA-1014 / DSM 16622 / JCM 12645 / Bem) TaxID=404380 RepID=B5E8X0_CITBB|nr:carbamoyltransferase HypF [Citrifermentans bemidjiense]ACH40134.1 hydrogenase maturation protein HypF [Citrifermentans bemidjiense Bem]